MRHTAVLVAFATLVLGCSTQPASSEVPVPQEPSVAPTVANAAPPRRDPPCLHAPVTLTVVGPTSVVPGATFDAVVNIVRPVSFATPMKLHLDVPTGATLVSGAQDETIVDPSGSSITRKFTLRLGAIPADDLVVTLDVSDPSWGVHGVQRYTFGRADPTPTFATGAGVPASPPRHHSP